MRIGIITPIVILLPRSHSEWEIDASVDDLVAVATATLTPLQQQILDLLDIRTTVYTGPVTS
jgi:hypothetical protein